MCCTCLQFYWSRGISAITERVLESFKRRSRVAILYSGKSGLSRAILQEQKRYPKLNFVYLIADCYDPEGEKLAKEFGLTYLEISGCCADQEQRDEYFQKLFLTLRSSAVGVVLYAGFKKIVPEFFYEIFPGISIHPSDLRQREGGRLKYGGSSAVSDAVRAGEESLVSTIFVMCRKHEPGDALVIGKKMALAPYLKRTIAAIHEKLRVHCEYQLYPKALELLASGALKSHPEILE